MKRTLALAAFAALAIAPLASTASADVIFPSGTKFIVGVPDYDEDKGAWECDIRCGGVFNTERVVGYRFLFREGNLISATEWIPDGGKIVCNPFQDFGIGKLYVDGGVGPASCEVGLK